MQRSTIIVAMPSTTSSRLLQLSVVQSIHSSCGNIFSGQQRQRATIPKIPRYIAIGGILLILLALSIAIACIDTSNIITFRACFGTLIGLLGILQLCVAVKLILNRCNPLLELSQPIPISILRLRCRSIMLVVLYDSLLSLFVFKLWVSKCAT